MDTADIRRLRVANQGILDSTWTSAGDVVSWLGAMQAQDYDAAKWAIGVRLPGSTAAVIEQAVAERAIVRTWPMRGTLHFVAAADVRWMLALLTPRVLAAAATRNRQLELDDATFARCGKLLTHALRDGTLRTRAELMALLEGEGIATQAQRGYHILWWAAQTGLICFGPLRGKQPAFALLEDWVPAAPALGREESLAALALRYFTGHGPATVQDLCWWSGLNLREARAGLAAVSPGLASETVEGQQYWMSPSLLETPAVASRRVCLLPGFDEFLLGYRDRSAVLDPVNTSKIVPGGNGVFFPTILIDGRVVGTWKRAVDRRGVSIAVAPFAPLSSTAEKSYARAAERYAAYLEVPLADATVIGATSA